MKWLKVLISLLFGVTTYAQIDVFPSQQEGLLWKISGNGLSSPSYLLGTMHLIDSERFVFPAQLDSIIRQSDELIMEIGELPDPFKTLNLLTLNEGSFFDFFSKNEANRIIQWANENLKMNEKSFRSMVDKWKPFAFVQLASQLAFTGETASYELELYTISKEQQLHISGLETVEDQIGFFDQLPRNDQKEMVLSVIESKETLVKEMDELQTVYLKENIDSIYIHINEQDEKFIFSADQLLDNRNKNWLSVFRSKLRDDKKLFIAVGAGHLGGNNGLLRGLQEQGFIVTPIRLNTLK